MLFRILHNSLHFNNMGFPTICSIIFDLISNSIQYSVSFASFKAIFILNLKSDLLKPRIPSFTLAPMLVPDLNNCLDKIYSCLSRIKNLYKFMISRAKSKDLVTIILESI